MDKETAEKLDEAANRFISFHKVFSIIECEYSFRQGAKWGIELQENKKQPINGSIAGSQAAPTTQGTKSAPEIVDSNEIL
jgi:hypothetical protein